MDAHATRRPAAGAPSQRFPRLRALIEYLDSLDHRADLTILERLLREADVTRADIAEACRFGTESYRRNTISRSAWYELLALCWRSGDVTPIHDHVGSSCAFKVIEGTCTEVRFTRTPSGLVCPSQTTQWSAGFVSGANDDDIHILANTQPPGRDLITMHIYSPPIRTLNTYRFGDRNPIEHVTIDAMAEAD